jgi:hypothetical protein
MNILDVIIEDAGGQLPKPEKHTKSTERRNSKGAKREAKVAGR